MFNQLLADYYQLTEKLLLSLCIDSSLLCGSKAIERDLEKVRKALAAANQAPSSQDETATPAAVQPPDEHVQLHFSHLSFASATVCK